MFGNFICFNHDHGNNKKNIRQMKTPIQTLVENMEDIQKNLILDHSRDIFKTAIKIIKAYETQEKQHLIKAFEAGEIDFNVCFYKSAEDFYEQNYDKN